MGRHLPQRGLPLIETDRRIRWTDRILVMTAILMAWCAAASQQEAFEQSRETVVGLYPTRRRPGQTLAGFLGALVGRTARLLLVVVRALRQASQEVAGPHWRIGLWVLMSVDGSRVECPRTAKNEEAFGCGGKKKTTPQQWLTTIYQVATGLVWDWRLGPATASEQEHAREMLAGLPSRTMLVGDCGFRGFELLRSVVDHGHDFVIRVGANVNLLRKLCPEWNGRDDIVYLWPDDRRGQMPLALRLVCVQNGRHRAYLLTNVLDDRVLTAQVIASIYALRWGIEVMYRSVKQTMGKRKLRSDSPEQAKAELNWVMVGFWLLGLTAIEQLIKADRPPHRWSVAKALRAFRRATRRMEVLTTHGGLFADLAEAEQDEYERHGSKQARNWPRKKTESPPGAPKIRMATRAEVRLVQQLRLAQAAE